MKDLFRHRAEGVQRNFSELLPYWGLTSETRGNHAVPALQGKFLCILGLTRSDFSELKRLLNHTGIQLHNNERTGLPYFFVEVTKNISSPLIVKDLEMTYHLKPLRNQTRNVQTWVHKHLWLPSDAEPFTITFHTSEEINIPEWLCYLLIQYFMQPMFQSLSSLSYGEYEQAVSTILKPLNPALAARQLALGRGSQEDWPDPPPEQDSGDAIDPFRTNHGSAEADPINPFRHQEKSTERTTFNPFRKNKS